MKLAGQPESIEVSARWETEPTRWLQGEVRLEGQRDALADLTTTRKQFRENLLKQGLQSLSDAELANLRTYLEHGGFLFASGCCTNPAFPAAWRRELARVFPGEKVEAMPYEHPIYRSFHRIERVRSLHRNVDVHLEGLFLKGRLVAVMCEDGLCCAFAMENRCNVGRGVTPDDGRKLALNTAVYAMTH